MNSNLLIRSYDQLKILLPTHELQEFMEFVSNKEYLLSQILHSQKLNKLKKLTKRKQVNQNSSSSPDPVKFDPRVVNLSNIELPKDKLELLKKGTKVFLASH